MLRQVGTLVSSHPGSAIALVVFLTVASGASVAMFGLEQQFDENSFNPDIEEVRANQKIADSFTSTYDISILVKARNDNLLTPAALADVLRIEWAVANDSIANELFTPDAPSASIYSLADSLAQNVLAIQGITVPTYAQKIAAVKNLSDDAFKTIVRRALDDPQFSSEIRRMLTQDFNATAVSAKGTIIFLRFNESVGHSDERALAIEQTVESIATGINSERIAAHTIGGQIITDEILAANNESMALLLPLAFGLVVVILALVYRDIVDMLFSLLALVFSILWMYGFGAAAGYSFNPMTTAIPVLLVGLGIDYGIHLTMRYREERKRGDGQAAVEKTIQFVGMALLLATVTTVIAFLSNVVSPISVLGEFGILCAVGIIASFVIMILFVPANKLLRDRRRTARQQPLKEQRNIFGGMLAPVSRMLVRHRTAVIAAALIASIFMAYSASHLETRFEYEDFLPDDLEITGNLKFFLNEFEVAGGEGEQVYVLIEADVADPELLRDIDEAITNMATNNYVVKNGNSASVVSILSVLADVAESNQTFAAMYEHYFAGGVPKQTTTGDNITALYDFLYAVAPNQVNMILNRNGGYDETVLRVAVSTDDDGETAAMYGELKEDILPLRPYDAVITGGPVLTMLSMDILEESQTQSLAITLLASLIVLTIIFYVKDRSYVLGALTLVPVAFCVLWILGSMYLFGIPLNVMTITIASLTIGLGVTYGIHVTHRFVEEIDGQDPETAGVITVQQTGSALFGAAATTIAGFGLLVFALMPPLQQFGSITALTILYSFIASTFILPAVLVFWARMKHSPAAPARVRK
jgi:hypothetical protein